MQRTPEQGVPEIKPLSLLERRLDWNLLKSFLEVAECGSFRGAAARLAIGTSTVSRHIGELEATLNAKLFLRAPNAVQLTEEDNRILDDVRAIERQVQSIGLSTSGVADKVAGRVTLAVTQGLGTYWLPFFFPKLREAYPELELELISEMKLADVLRHEADVALQYLEPTNLDIVSKLIGHVHIWPYVSKSYAEKFGVPTTMPELCKHHLIIQEADQLETESLTKAVGATFDQLNITLARSSTAHYEMIRSGNGLGILPTYLGFGDPNLVPVPIRVEYALPLRLCYHEQQRNTPRVRAVIDWLTDAFAAKNHAFFGKELLTPFDLAELEEAPEGTTALIAKTQA